MILRSKTLKHKSTQVDFVCPLTQCNPDRVNIDTSLISFANQTNIFEAALNSPKRFFTKPFILLALVIGILGLNSTHQLAKQYHTKKLTTLLEAAASKANQQIDSELAKFQQIPDLLSHDPRLINYFRHQNSSDNLNQLLAEWSQQSLADTIYVHALNGDVVASSNYQQPNTFVGQNFAFRPYFKQAIQGQDSQYVALGVRSNVRGYFLSSPLIENNEILGVITVKVSLENIEQLITSESSDVIVLDSNKVAFLSSNTEWLYRSFFSMTPEQRQQIRDSRQYGQEPISPITTVSALLSSQQTLPTDQLISSKNYNIFAIPFNNNGYQVIALKSAKPLFKSIAQADLIFLVIYGLIVLIAWSWRQTYKAKLALTDLNQHLEQTVDKRTQHLQQTNQQLQQTIFQYQESQLKLKQTEQELTQAAKLAVLGELSASINHEINQPLAALRTYSENSVKLLAMGKNEMVASNLSQMIALNTSISEIIARLKIFTRKVTKQEHHQANLHDAVNNATGLLSPQLIRQGITLRLPLVPSDIVLSIHPTELEQVLVNLIHNAIQAFSGQQSPQIGVEWRLNDNVCELMVWDNGPGISSEKLEQLFDPFFTTKPEGLGLGLSISKRIIEAYHGTINATCHSTNGMLFSMTIPLYQSIDGSSD